MLIILRITLNLVICINELNGLISNCHNFPLIPFPKVFSGCYKLKSQMGRKSSNQIKCSTTNVSRKRCPKKRKYSLDQPKSDEKSTPQITKSSTNFTYCFEEEKVQKEQVRLISFFFLYSKYEYALVTP